MERTALELRTLVDRLAAAAVGTDLEDTAARAALLAATLASDVGLVVATYERVLRPVLLAGDAPGALQASPVVLVNPPGTGPVAPAQRDVG